MKICYLADANSIHAQRWIKYFADKGHEVHLISPKRISSSDINNFSTNNLLNVRLHVLNAIPHIRNITFPMEIAYNALQVKMLLKKIKPDILHAHNMLLCGIVGALSGFHPFVSSAFGSDILVDPKRSVIIKKWIKYALAKSDVVTCDGENSRKTILDFGVDSKKVRLILYGVDTKKFKPLIKENNRNNLKAHPGLTVISIRRLEKIYNIDSLIDAMPLILKEVSDANFIIGGEGSEKENLKKLAKSRGVINRINFAGKIPHDELPAYFNSSDVYVSTSLSDGGISISTLEALACGLPPVVTDVADNAKWIKDGRNGYIVPVKDPKTLAKKIIYLLKHKDIRIRFGTLGRDLVKQKADYYVEMEKMMSIYTERGSGI